jgi:Dolichyl-phosphate-mannose-protein mannosyltransferase
LKAIAKCLLCSLPVIVTVAFVIRLAFYLPMVHQTYREVVVDFPYGAETGAVAAAIAQGRGFSSPLRLVQTGPTAWFAPIFPYLLGGIFTLFGVYSYASNLVIHFFDFAFAAFTCWPIAAIGTRAFAKRTGIAAAWTWVFLPTAIFYPVVWVWDTSLAALWLAMLVAATLQLRGSDRMSWWIGYGALWSAGAMINPSLIAVLPPLALWAIWPLRSRTAPALKLASAAALIFAVGIVPWTVRNYVVFHKFIPLRSNFGLELWLGNNPDVPDSWSWWLHPNDYLSEARKYAAMTEIPYMEEKGREAWAFIRSHPVDTAQFALHRFSNHWLGVWDSPIDLWAPAPWYLKLTLIFSCAFALLAWLGLLLAYRIRSAVAHPLATVMMIFPLAFYLTHTSLRYRFPMDPVMLVLAVFAVEYAVSPAARRPAGATRMTTTAAIARDLDLLPERS